MQKFVLTVSTPHVCTVLIIWFSFSNYEGTRDLDWANGAYGCMLSKVLYMQPMRYTCTGYILASKRIHTIHNRMQGSIQDRASNTTRPQLIFILLYRGWSSIAWILLQVFSPSAPSHNIGSAPSQLKWRTKKWMVIVGWLMNNTCILHTSCSSP